MSRAPAVGGLCRIYLLIQHPEVWKVRDSLSAVVFNTPGRCSAASVIPLWRHHCHSSQAAFDRFGDLVPPYG